MQFSNFADAFFPDAGILRLMDDHGKAVASGKNFCMLGGGNPARIPEIETYFRERMQNMLANADEFEQVVGVYDGPEGNIAFIDSIVSLLNKEYGWGLTRNNVTVTNGSQASFFVLFNLFAGEFSDGTFRKILLPLAPEYIGYADAGLGQNIFRSNKPVIDQLDENTFKYRVDFNTLAVGNDVGAICVSRPTNPTGNVLTDEEVAHLSGIASDNNIPLILDNAYGTPFPSILFEDVKPVWNENTVLCMSLSKLGLPGVRTGLVIANEEIIQKINGSNAILNLAPGSFGPALALDAVANGEILTLSDKIIQPFYKAKAKDAADFIKQALAGYPLNVHKAEGAIFLWLWFPKLPVSSQTLYERLKQLGVLVLAGHNFFPGLEDDDWTHRHECIRVSYAPDQKEVERGLAIIAEEVKRLYNAQAKSV